MSDKNQIINFTAPNVRINQHLDGEQPDLNKYTFEQRQQAHYKRLDDELNVFASGLRELQSNAPAIEEAIKSLRASIEQQKAEIKESEAGANKSVSYLSAGLESKIKGQVAIELGNKKFLEKGDVKEVNLEGYIKWSAKSIGTIIVLGLITAGLIGTILNVWVMGRIRISECKQETTHQHSAGLIDKKQYQKDYSECIKK